MESHLESLTGMNKFIFDKLEDWRHLPNYQLERRLDIFISMYIKELVEERVKWRLSDVIIPEFPISRKTLGETVGVNKTVKVDYVLFPLDFKNPIIFLELKTDNSSVRDEQTEYLLKSKENGINEILKGLEEVYVKSKSKPKYEYLFKKLDATGLTKTNWLDGIRKDSKKKPKFTILPSIPEIELILLLGILHYINILTDFSWAL